MDLDYDRDSIRLLASGKYLDLNKSFDQHNHQHFVEGALFILDLMSKKERESKLKQGVENANVASETVV